MDITRQQAQDLANFWRTINPATPAEQAVIDKLESDEDAFIAETAHILATPTVTTQNLQGTVTTYTLYSPEALRSAGRNRARRTSSR
ncbi:hypothetical protein [Streptomyces glaucescens]|uniref:hypothetical protein n=1 Tax=Streptomyces glaucescens TaxID=1907 RepID=UPI000A3C1D25|nr:hypothetical protein [Streptomyces glaucescens]